jgi:tetratricopeptide (TPR) repeat protein
MTIRISLTLAIGAAITLGASLGAVQAGVQPVEYRSPAGIEYRSQPDTDAITQAKTALAAEPRSVARIIDLGVAQSGARQFREAIATFTRGLEIEPNNALLLRWRGHRYLSIREFDNAFADLTRGSKIDPSIYGIWYHLGIVQFVRGDFSGAAASFTRAQPIAPDPGELAGSTDWLWMSLSRAGRTAEAKAMLDRKPESRLPPIDNAYSRRLKLYRGEIGPDAVITPADTDDVQIATLAFGLGNWYLIQGDSAKAKAAFERSVASGGWPGFGFILSEVELKRIHPDRFAGTPAAKAEFAKGKSLEIQNEWEQAALAYKHAWTIDPEFADAHDAYSWARQRQALGDISKLGKMTADERKALHERTKAMDDAVVKEYDDLIASHPNAPIYKWAQAQHYNESNIDLQGKLCRETVEMDPKFTPGYRCLATVALVRGDFDIAADSWRHVMTIDGESPELWLRLARSEREVPAKYKALTDELIAHMPDTDTAAQALEMWAESLPVTERIAAFERLITEYPPQQFKSTIDGAMWLFTLYDDLAPAKAAALAHKISTALPEDKEWQAKVVYSDTLSDAERKAETDGAAALALLKTVKVPSYVSKQRLLIVTARAQDRAGQLDAAYGDLLKAYAPTPGPKLESALYAYGRRLNKDTATVDKEVWALRTAAAKPATPFSLESFVDGKQVSLSDFKGKVVLLDFWFPNCGPCRSSFPLLERLYAKHKADGLVYLGVNGLEDQNPQVLPLWKSLRWSFTPLKATEKWSDEVYGVTGYPTTFFIGADQQTYFKTHVYDENTFAIADMQLTALLKAAKK